MLAMWFLFTARKLVFWVNILLVQKLDLEPWESSYKITNKVNEIQKNVDGKVQELTLLLNSLDALKKAK